MGTPDAAHVRPASRSDAEVGDTVESKAEQEPRAVRRRVGERKMSPAEPSPSWPAPRPSSLTDFSGLGSQASPAESAAPDTARPWRVGAFFPETGISHHGLNTVSGVPRDPGPWPLGSRQAQRRFVQSGRPPARRRLRAFGESLLSTSRLGEAGWRIFRRARQLCDTSRLRDRRKSAPPPLPLVGSTLSATQVP